MIKFATSVVLLLSTGLPYSAHAIVNIESERIKEPEAGFSGKLALSANGQSGNTDKSRVSFGTRLQWHQQQITSFIVISLDQGETNGVRDTNKKFFHARHIRQLSEKRSWEIFGQVEENEFTRLTFRGLVGSGIRLRLGKQSKKQVMYLGLGAFRYREELEQRTGTNDAGIERGWRANIYFSIKYRFTDNSRIVSTSYYQPAFNDNEDYRFLEQVSLVVNLNKHLNLKLSVDIVHDNRPPQLIEKTDTTYSTGIEYRF